MRPAPQTASFPRARFTHLGLLFAWLLASGMHLDVVQLYAWTTMGFRFARTESVGEAIVTTFKPGSMCHLCHAVNDARKQQRAATAVLTDETKPLIVFLALPAVCLAPPRAERWVGERIEWSGVDRRRPPLPPPRRLA